jgi:hypothetical protein
MYKTCLLVNAVTSQLFSDTTCDVSVSFKWQVLRVTSSWCAGAKEPELLWTASLAGNKADPHLGMHFPSYCPRLFFQPNRRPPFGLQECSAVFGSSLYLLKHCMCDFYRSLRHCLFQAPTLAERIFESNQRIPCSVPSATAPSKNGSPASTSDR